MTLEDRLDRLAAAAAAARAIGLDEAASRADDVVRRARERVGFPGASYVLALAGGPGSGSRRSSTPWPARP